MRPTFRSLTPPLITILVLSGGMGCDTEAKRERRRLEEEAARRKAETEPPTPEVLAQVKDATAAYLREHHATLVPGDYTFTALTPNLFLVGVSTKDPLGKGGLMQLSAERLRDVEERWFGGMKENGDLLWVIDTLDSNKMKTLAERHGLEGEVDALRRSGARRDHAHSWGPRSWLDDYLLWHFLFRRPSPFGWNAGMGFQPRPMGFRFHDPMGAPIRPEDARPYEDVAGRTGGRSSVFLGGSAWRPPLVSQAGPLSGQAFQARGSGIGAHASKGSALRAGFGAAGRRAGGSFGG